MRTLFVRWDNLEKRSKPQGAAARVGESAVRTFVLPRRSGSAFTRCRHARRLNQVPKSRGCRSAGRSTRTAAAPTHASYLCFARPTHTYLDFNAREDFEREIVVKVNAPEVLRADCAGPLEGRARRLGTNTDPYQWVEGRYRLMEGIWEAMRDFANPCSVLTKSRCFCATSS